RAGPATPRPAAGRARPGSPGTSASRRTAARRWRGRPGSSSSLPPRLRLVENAVAIRKGGFQFEYFVEVVLAVVVVAGQDASVDEREDDLAEVIGTIDGPALENDRGHQAELA